MALVVTDDFMPHRARARRIRWHGSSSNAIHGSLKSVTPYAESRTVEGNFWRKPWSDRNLHRGRIETKDASHSVSSVCSERRRYWV